MSWTYTGNLETDAQAVRLLVGDTNPHDQLVTDDELSFILGQNSDIYLAAAAGCDVIIAKLARDVDRNDIGMSATRSQQIQHYTDLRVSLLERASTEGEPYFGGSSESEKASDALNTDLPQPAFKRGMNDNA